MCQVDQATVSSQCHSHNQTGLIRKCRPIRLKTKHFRSLEHGISMSEKSQNELKTPKLSKTTSHHQKVIPKYATRPAQDSKRLWAPQDPGSFSAFSLFQPSKSLTFFANTENIWKTKALKFTGRHVLHLTDLWQSTELERKLMILSNLIMESCERKSAREGENLVVLWSLYIRQRSNLGCGEGYVLLAFSLHLRGSDQKQRSEAAPSCLRYTYSYKCSVRI